MQHLFFKCPPVNKIIKEIEAIFNRSGLTANIEIKELNIMLGLNVHCKCFLKLFFQVLKIV
jgi:hypothetical protein